MCGLLDEARGRGEIVKFIAEDQGRESCYSFVTMVRLRCDSVRVEAISGQRRHS